MIPTRFFSVLVILAALSVSASTSIAQDKTLVDRFHDPSVLSLFQEKSPCEKYIFPMHLGHDLKLNAGSCEFPELTVRKVLKNLIFDDFEAGNFKSIDFKYEFPSQFGDRYSARPPQMPRGSLKWRNSGVSDIIPTLHGSGITPAGDIGVALENLVEIGSDGEIYQRPNFEPVLIFVGVGYSESSNALTMMSNKSNYPGSKIDLQEIFVLSRFNVDHAANSVQAAELMLNYRNVISMKFNESNDQVLTDHLLNSARGDTVSGYSPVLHGKGEVSLDRALAPLSIK